jgi:hypothetical protein
MMNPVAKGLLFVFGVPVLFGISYFYYAMSTGEKRMKEVCGQIKPGMNLAQLKAHAEEHGLKAPNRDSGITYLPETKTYGRFACKVVLDAGIVKSSEYNYAD